MENEMKKCPYCAEMIKKEAIKCRYCGSMLTSKSINFDFLVTPGHWHRVNEGKKAAGVCTGIARELDSPALILPLRLFFILTTIFYGFGIILYIILWILMPSPEMQHEHSAAPNAEPPAGYAVNYGEQEPAAEPAATGDTVEIADEEASGNSESLSDSGGQHQPPDENEKQP